MIRRFMEEENGPKVLILSLKAGGIGLNLTRANHVIHFDRWWNPAVENRATNQAFQIETKTKMSRFINLCLSAPLKKKLTK